MVRTCSALPGATASRMNVRNVGWLWLFSVTLYWLHTKGTLAVHLLERMGQEPPQMASVTLPLLDNAPCRDWNLGFS